MKDREQREIICRTQITFCMMFNTGTMVADDDGFAIPLLTYWRTELSKVVKSNPEANASL